MAIGEAEQRDRVNQRYEAVPGSTFPVTQSDLDEWMRMFQARMVTHLTQLIAPSSAAFLMATKVACMPDLALSRRSAISASAPSP